MSSISHAQASSVALINLRSNLISLSDNLQELFDLLSDNLSALASEWEDEKFAEFDDEFRSSREKILLLADKYREWADVYLPPRIEKIIQAEKLGMAIK